VEEREQSESPETDTVQEDTAQEDTTPSPVKEQETSQEPSPSPQKEVTPFDPTQANFSKSPIKSAYKSTSEKGLKPVQKTTVDSLESEWKRRRKASEGLGSRPPKHPSSFKMPAFDVPDHPLDIELKGELANLQREIAQERNKLVSNLNSKMIDEIRNKFRMKKYQG
jgi:hypothetical protein